MASLQLFEGKCHFDGTARRLRNILLFPFRIGQLCQKCSPQQEELTSASTNKELNRSASRRFVYVCLDLYLFNSASRTFPSRNCREMDLHSHSCVRNFQARISRRIGRVYSLVPRHVSSAESLNLTSLSAATRGKPGMPFGMLRLML